MKSTRWGWGVLVFLAGTLAFGTGVALACNGNYAEPWDTTHCVNLDEVVQDSACVDLTGTGSRRCATCDRETFLCIEGEDFVARLGQAYNCGSPGSSCQ